MKLRERTALRTTARTLGHHMGPLLRERNGPLYWAECKDSRCCLGYTVDTEKRTAIGAALVIECVGRKRR